MPKEQAIDRGPTKRQPRKGKPRQPEFAHEIEALVGKSSEQEQRKINGDRSPSLPSRERLALCSGGPVSRNPAPPKTLSLPYAQGERHDQ
jgi:hypothetical protein